MTSEVNSFVQISAGRKERCTSANAGLRHIYNQPHHKKMTVFKQGRKTLIDGFLFLGDQRKSKRIYFFEGTSEYTRCWGTRKNSKFEEKMGEQIKKWEGRTNKKSEGFSVFGDL